MVYAVQATVDGKKGKVRRASAHTKHQGGDSGPTHRLLRLQRRLHWFRPRLMQRADMETHGSCQALFHMEQQEDTAVEMFEGIVLG